MTALARGSPVFLSQTIVVSLWFVMPTPTIRLISTPSSFSFSMTASTQSSTDFNSSFGLCSTQLKRWQFIKHQYFRLFCYLSWGNSCSTSIWCSAITLPVCASKTMNLKNFMLLLKILKNINPSFTCYWMYPGQLHQLVLYQSSRSSIKFTEIE